MAPAKEDVRPAKPEEQELARKREEQTALEAELADRELRAANLRAELGAFERNISTKWDFATPNSTN